VKAFDRRMVLKAGLLALLVPAGTACERESRRPLLRLRDVRSAAKIGEAWLERADPRPNAAELTAALTREAPGNAAALAEHLRRRHLEDFASGRTLLVGSWLLSETEVRIYALAALG
jgi:hypothetical protein